ncbi:unnamed protein product [Pieris macdunnoughi]|uniref:Retrovirus-related Pol polyprotein from transposon TNT 1-94 n=1 Tax=Pieris macdunnoughi TaxID=345717 RepID=A0A821XI50_9NEOP|nr:unnamed protein product [Pieris macdunnoughi]
MASNYLVNVPKLKGRENYSEWVFAAENFLVLEDMAYVTQIVETGQKLSGTGFKISDEWIGCLLLAGLTEKFMPMIMAIEHSGIQITTDAIRTKLMDMETEVGSQSSEIGGAFASGAQKWQPKKNKNVSAGAQSQAKSNVSVSGGAKSHVKCYRCKQTGHYKNQCPNNDNSSNHSKELQRKQSNAFSVVFLSGQFNKYDWYIDSGASMHLTANEKWIKDATYHDMREICVANNEKLQVLCSGDVNIVTKTDQFEYEIPVKDVMCAPGLTTNLLSVSQLIETGNRVQFTSEGCNVFNRNNEMVAMAVLSNGVYRVRLADSEVTSLAVSGDVWHRRLGHVNSTYLNKMSIALEGMDLQEKVDINKSSCPVCCEGKQCRLPFPSGSRCNELLGLVHTDICGPMEHESLGGSSKKIKILRSDNGCEYCNKEFDSLLKNEGIIHQRSNPYTPEQNGVSELNNRTVVEKARCLLFDAKLGKEFWAEATHTAVYLQNRTVLPSLNDKTPYEVWFGHKPNVSHLRIFGSSVMVHVAKARRQKWDKKAEKHILVGYPDGIKGYRIYNPRTKCITTSREVIVMEKDKHPDITIPVIESERKENSCSVGDIEDKEVSTLENVTSADETTITDETLGLLDEDYISSDYEDASDLPARPKSTRIKKNPEKYKVTNMCVPEEFDDANVLSIEERGFTRRRKGPVVVSGKRRTSVF